MRLLKAVVLALCLPLGLVAASIPPQDFAEVAEKCGPWVVNISTSHTVREVYSPFGNDPFFNMFFDQPNGGRTVRRQSLGSGLILTADGQVLTNAHVVAGADEITVTLLSGESLPAKVLGQDDKVDLAVLKIAPKKPLTPAVLGDSDKVRPGQWAIAIGNPLGFDHSVTVGVISAKGRTNVFGGDGQTRYQNFLQTDASINQGNSGGPLCNARGQVIGINSAIATPNQGSVGLGFAIPINMVKRAIPDLVKRGRVVPPQLGFYSQDVTPQLARAMKLEATQGVLVSDVAAGGPADKAGLQRSDVIVAVAGMEVASSTDLRNALYESKAGQPIAFKVLRRGKVIDLTMVGEDPKVSAKAAYWHGLQVESNSQEVARSRGLFIARGVVVTAVAKGSSGEETGLMPGDVILELAERQVKDKAAWEALVADLDETRDVLMRVVRGRELAYVVVKGE